MSDIVKSVSKDKSLSPGNSQQTSSVHVADKSPNIISDGKLVDSNTALVSDIRKQSLKAIHVPQTPFDLEWISCEPATVHKKAPDISKGVINKGISASTKSLFGLKSNIMDLSTKHLPPSIPSTPPVSSMSPTQSDVFFSANPPATNTTESLVTKDSSVIDLKIDEEEYNDDISVQVLQGQMPSHDDSKRKSTFDELDEPIIDTLLHDLRGIYSKMKLIILPMSSYDTYRIALRGWDLWGPLILCTFLAINLHHPESMDRHSGPHFAEVFVLIWFGSCTISLNYRLLSLTSSSQRDLLSESNPASQQSSSSINNVGNMLFPGNDIPQQDHDTAQQNQDRMRQPKTIMAPPSIFQLMCVFGYCLVPPCFGLVLIKILSLSFDFSFHALFSEKLIIGMIFGFLWPTFCSVKILVRYQEKDKRVLAIYPIGLFYFILSWMIILNH